MSLRVGQEAPDFTATAVYDQEFKDITLSSFKGKWVVLFFYPLDFTFVCPTEITAFSDAWSGTGCGEYVTISWTPASAGDRLYGAVLRMTSI